ncbi:MAG TPA: hypothetical protein VGG19_18345 [Tepidisphaeraceae bacterium]|jgi:hypothetical protein
MKRSILALGLACIGILACGSVSRAADTIYQDNFDGTGGILSGRALDTASGLDGGTLNQAWTSDSATSSNPDALITASGGTYSGTGTTSAAVGTFTTGADSNMITNAYLPIVPQTGYIYDAHVAIAASAVGASGNWLGMTFAPANMNGHTAGGGASALSNLAGYGLIIDKGTNTVQSFGGAGTGNAELSGVPSGFNSNSTTTPVYNTFDIILNTSGSQWTVSWLVNGVAPSGVGSTSYTYTSNPSIGNIVIGTNKLTGAFSDFSLTATAVPEPTSFVMLALAALPFAARRRV